MHEKERIQLLDAGVRSRDRISTQDEVLCSTGILQDAATALALDQICMLHSRHANLPEGPEHIRDLTRGMCMR